MKTLLRNPKSYIWTVLVLLPLQAYISLYALGTNSAAWVSIVTKQPDRFPGLYNATTKLTYLSLALVVVDIACLLIAVNLLKNRKAEVGAGRAL